MKFTIISQTKTGERKQAVIDAPDKFAAAKIVRDLGEFPISATPWKPAQQFSDVFAHFFSRITLHEKILFTRNLSGMLSAGLSLYRALDVLKKQSANQKLSSVLEALMKTIDSGGSLSAAMEKFPKVFSTIFIAMVKAGEESGSLAKSLKEIGVHLEKEYTLIKKIKGAMTYPMIIVAAVFLIGILMFIFVVPTLVNTFAELDAELPSSTKIVIFISNALSKHTLLFFGILFSTGISLYFLSKLRSVKYGFEYCLLRIPVIGLITKEVNAARTTRTLASLLAAGVSVTRAILITRDVIQNHFYKEVLATVANNVEKGVPISKAIKENIQLYPVMVGEMIEVGEETGNLSVMLSDIASFYEDEVDLKTKDLTTIIEPILMILIGAAVGFFAISMITPMYSLVNAI